jgi:hypothetical protein
VRWPRRKRWEYWALATPRHLLAVVVADVDYIGLAAVTLLDLASGERFEAGAVTPAGLGVRLPDGVNTAPVRFRCPGVRVAIEPRPGEVGIRASARSLRGHRVEADVVAVYPPGQQTLDVTVPFDRERSHFTSKHVGLPARGRVTWDGEPLPFDDAWACLDHGRGVWPYRTSWCWAAAAGTSGGRRVAFNLGALWTDGTGTTENGFWIDGRLHRIGATLTFRRASPGWLVEGLGVSLAATPVRERPLQANLGVLRADLDWTMARFTGSLADDEGTRLDVEGLLGWCERLDARW